MQEVYEQVILIVQIIWMFYVVGLDNQLEKQDFFFHFIAWLKCIWTDSI